MPNFAAMSARDGAPGSSGSNCVSESNNAALRVPAYSSCNRLSACARTVEGHLGPLVTREFFQRNEPLSFPALDRHCAAPFVGHKIFDRSKQIRTKSPPFFADCA